MSHSLVRAADTALALITNPPSRIETASKLPSAADLDVDAEEKATGAATSEGMPEPPKRKRWIPLPFLK
jgi:hypothetical protein